MIVIWPIYALIQIEGQARLVSFTDLAGAIEGRSHENVISSSLEILTNAWTAPYLLLLL